MKKLIFLLFPLFVFSQYNNPTGTYNFATLDYVSPIYQSANTIYKLRGYSVNIAGCGFSLSDTTNGRTCIGAIKLK